MNDADEQPRALDEADVTNAEQTLRRLLGRMGIGPDDASELIALVEAGVLAVARREVDRVDPAPDPAPDPADPDPAAPYARGRRDGLRAAAERLDELTRQALGPALPGRVADPEGAERPPVTRMSVERAKVAVTPLHLSFTEPSDLDPEVSDQVLRVVLGTMGTGRRAGYAGHLSAFAEDNRTRLERLYAQYGPGSAVAVHGRHLLLHSPAGIAVLERLVTAPDTLREEWDAAELPPAWLEGLATAWG
ncbi:hypothetical protein ACN20G_32820 (plasmid) [Streptomyces sp. BI20]|uniref:hypothetical protein n=1 Tax=Streptomyces sp. BI20 TaxID=3403460 RepID=UPI003C7195F8